MLQIGGQCSPFFGPHSGRRRQSFEDHGLDDGPVVSRVVFAAGVLIHDAGQHQQCPQIERLGRATLHYEGLELRAITGEHGRIDPVVLGRSVAFDAEIELHGAAADRLPRESLDIGLESGVTFAGAITELEMAAIDGPHFDGDGQAIRLASRLAKAGHADEQV